jgi:hypothetical protein
LEDRVKKMEKGSEEMDKIIPGEEEDESRSVSTLWDIDFQ